MTLPIFYIWGLPIFVWLGITLAILVLIQMSIGAKILKVNFHRWHKRIIPILILIVLFFHAWYGIQLYWPFGK
jgi:hypothetical protein